MALLALALCALSLDPRAASADGVTGTYTGSVALRGNYYYERSTRVVAPAVTATMATPQGIRLDATYLLDAITSASVATGVQADAAFTEKRHDFQAGAGYEIDFGGTQLDLSLRGRFSREPDYHSRGFGFSSALSFNERNSILRLNGYFVHDDVFKVDRMAPAQNPRQLVASRALYQGTLDTLSLGLAFDQLLSPLATLTLGYDLGVMSGFTWNPYRMAKFNTMQGGAAPELHPDLRLRHAVYGWFSHFVPRTRSSLRAGYRVYRDDWGITAHAPELRVYQELGEHFQVRLRYRYYTQSGADFWRPNGNLRTDRYRTADPKMSDYLDHTMGLNLRLGLGFLRGTVLRVFAQAVLDLTAEYMICTSRYGDAVIAQGGLIWPF